MWALRQTVILSTLLQAVACAWAEGPGPQNASVPGSPNVPSRPSPRMHYFLNERFISQMEKPATVEPKVESNFHGEPSGSVNNKPDPLDTKHPSGLNFVLTGPNPGLEYRFSEKDDVHFRIGRHGVAAAWSF
jgi:hypothetical protein